MTRIELTDAELVVLDGHCRPEVQADVERAKERLAMAARLSELTPERAGFVADVVRSAQENGKLVFWEISLSRCEICKRSDGYHTHKRSGRWHRKGDVMFDRPKMFAGVEFKATFIRIRGLTALGCCHECFAAVRQPLLASLAEIRAELPEKLTGRPPRFRFAEKRHCDECGWDGNELQMGRRPTLMGDGSFPAICPKCRAENRIFGKQIVRVADGFDVVDVRAKSEVA